MLWQDGGKAAQPGSARLEESPSSACGTATLSQWSERCGSHQVNKVGGWLVQKYLSKAQRKDALRLVDPEAQFIRTSSWEDVALQPPLGQGGP